MTEPSKRPRKGYVAVFIHVWTAAADAPDRIPEIHGAVGPAMDASPDRAGS